MIDEETLDRAIHFHGHMCPGLAMGLRAAEVALTEIGPHSQDEEVVAIVETDMCAIDGIQFLTGCTYGKGNLIVQNNGKCVYTFLRRSDGRAVRISTRQGWGPGDYRPLVEEVDSPTMQAPDEGSFPVEALGREAARIMQAPLDDLYDVREVQVSIPRPARGFDSITCASCGEATMETVVRRLDGRELCPPCFERAMSDSG